MFDNNIDKNTTVLYHADCPDGFGGALVAYKKFADKAVYLPVHHNEPYPKQVIGRDVYMIDFCYPKDVMAMILKEAKQVVAIDHHITGSEVVESLEYHLFDNNNSGSVLAWKYFFPGTSVPKFFQYIEDGDLWRFDLPLSKEVNSAICSYNFDFSLWNSLMLRCESEEGIKQLGAEGDVLLRSSEEVVQKAVKYAEEVEFEGHRALMANSLVYVSRIGNELSKKKPPIGIVWSRRGKKIIVSLRSDGTVDVAKLAEEYGGGGHAAASGFSFEEEDFLRFKRI